MIKIKIKKMKMIKDLERVSLYLERPARCRVATGSISRVLLAPGSISRVLSATGSLSRVLFIGVLLFVLFIGVYIGILYIRIMYIRIMYIRILYIRCRQHVAHIFFWHQAACRAYP